jgi:flavodoxin
MNMLKRLFTILFAMMLTVSCLQMAVAEENAVSEQNVEPASHILVVYFSATGTTKGVAEKLAEGLSADLYEIVPEEPYTDADLNYNNSKSRTSIETDDPSCRPAIAGELPDLSAYDTILVGYPIWWGDVPRIVSNFVENVDLTGKILAVFFTSGSSGLGSSMKHLEAQAGAGTWLEGKRFSARTTVEELTQWAASLGIEP